MDDTTDPLHQFFTPEEADKDDILYHALEVTPQATAEEIRKSYRRLALRYHPDKHSSKTSKEQNEASGKFQQIGFAYAVLSDEKRKKVYDSTGKTDERWSDVEEMGWDKYFEGLFERVDRKVLDEDKKKYQGSEEEKEDLKQAYVAHKGSWPTILDHIPHASHTDEDRLIGIINGCIAKGELTKTKKWESTSMDKKAKEKRAKAASKEAKQAEEAAKELGVWDEFYGSGKKGKRNNDKASGEEGLHALILKRQQERSSGLDRLAEKYAALEQEEKAKKGKGKKRKSEAEDPGEMTDEQFAALQAKMFGGKDKNGEKGKKKSKA